MKNFYVPSIVIKQHIVTSKFEKCICP